MNLSFDHVYLSRVSFIIATLKDRFFISEMEIRRLYREIGTEVVYNNWFRKTLTKSIKDAARKHFSD